MIIYMYVKYNLDECTIYSNATFYLYLSLHQFQYCYGSHFPIIISSSMSNTLYITLK